MKGEGLGSVRGDSHRPAPTVPLQDTTAVEILRAQPANFSPKILQLGAYEVLGVTHTDAPMLGPIYHHNDALAVCGLHRAYP